MTAVIERTKQRNLLFLGTEEDKSYRANLKGCIGTANVACIWSEVDSLTEVTFFCKQRGITGVICTQEGILIKLLAKLGNHKKHASLDNYQGSYFTSGGIEFVFLAPLKQLQTVPYGSFIAKRFCSKLTAPQTWNAVPSFNWEMLNATNHERIFHLYQSAIAIAVDIETFKDPLAIRCVGYTALFLDASSGKFSTHSCVIPLDSLFNLAVVRKFNWELKAPKVLQNGKYDCSYLARFNAPLYNYLWDTANMFHSWYSELPKDLAFMGSFFLRESMYWKDLSETKDLHEYYRYNALDTWNTMLVFIRWILEAPEWAKQNYKNEFPLVFACHLSEMTGIQRDAENLEAAKSAADGKIATYNEQLSRMLGVWPVVFNVASNPQNIRLRKVLGCEDILSSDETSLKRIALRHPINSRICNKILDIREYRKLASTYLVKEKDFNGRVLYSLNPHGTDTTRLASREHHFWTGLQVQNVPRGKAVKITLRADEGFAFAECDLKQAETRDTAYISGDAALIAAVNSPRDFHAINASAFFGVAYELIFDDATGKTLDKALRDLSKRTNHGASYLMGAKVLIETMGEEKVWEAKRLLCLPRRYSLMDVAEHLLFVFHQTYPTLSRRYYPAVVKEIMTTGRITHHATFREPKIYGTVPVWETDDEWANRKLEGLVRQCFGNPDKNKRDKNSYVAHVSQSLNAQALNRAYLRVFYEIAMNPKYAAHFKLIAQIHDSILFQFRIGHEYLCKMVQERMEVACKILSYDGVEREFIVPADIKAGSDGKGATHWAFTE